MGWGSGEEVRTRSAGTAVVFVAAATAYWGTIWIASGLAPLPYFASRAVGAANGFLNITRSPVTR